MTVELWRGADARWRWRYVEPTRDGRPLVLHGNKHHATRAEALRSASTAYPGVPVLERTPAPPRRRRLRWLLAAARSSCSGASLGRALEVDQGA